MKILFLGFGITPYYRDFLNRLNSIDGVDVDNIRPKGDNKNLGAGVYQDFSKISFSDLQFPEIEVPHRRILGLVDFETQPAYKSFDGITKYLDSNRPTVIVVNTVYHALFHYDKEVLNIVKEIGAKTIFHSIPFNLKSFNEFIESLPKPTRLELERFPFLRKLVRTLQIDVLYARFIRLRTIRRPAYQKCKILRRPDAHAIYHDEGVDTYNSYGVPKEKIFVVRNSPNTEKLLKAANQYPAISPNLRLIHIGRLVGWKRVDLLIQALARLKHYEFPEIDLVVIGYGPCEDPLKELAIDLNVQDAVHFLGGVYDPNDLAKQARKSSIYVLAGMGGLSINEAMCFELPIICSRCDGTEKFLVRNGINGFFFAEGDLHDLTEKIAVLLRDKVQRLEMGKRSREIIENEINTEIHVNNYLKMFEQITGQVLSPYKGHIANC